jgi:hypothetical protein
MALYHFTDSWNWEWEAGGPVLHLISFDSSLRSLSKEVFKSINLHSVNETYKI